METGPQTPRRGRPPTITRERIANAGIDVGLPRITVVGIAAWLGVSHMALYKHVPSLEALKRLVAEEIFSRWRIPQAANDGPHGLQSYLTTFSASLRALVKAHPGLAPYLIRRRVTTPSMLAKIDAHHDHVARSYGIPKADARWLLSTVAFHCIALADTVYSIVDDEHIEPPGNPADEAEIEAEFDLGMRALIVGALAMQSGAHRS